MGRKNLKAADYIQAIHAADGVISQAADRLGVERSSVYRACDRFSTVQDALEEARRVTIDEAEGQLIKAMKQGEAWAIRMILRTQAGDRWVETEKREIDHKGGPIQVIFEGKNA